MKTTQLRRLFASLDNGAWGEEPREDGSDTLCVRAADFDFTRFRVSLASAPLRQIDARPRNRLLLRCGDIVLEKSGGGEKQVVGRAVLYDEDRPAICSNFAARIRPAAGVNSRYLTYLLAALYFNGATARAVLQTTGIQNLDTDAWLPTPVPELALHEQRRIADFLDDQVARIDSIVAARLEQLNQLQRWRDSLAEESIRRNGSVELPLRRVVQRWIDYRGATPTKTESGVPLVTARNIRDGRVDMDVSREYIAANDYDAWMRRGLPKLSDVLLTTEAPLGQVAQISDVRVALAQRIILLRPDVSLIRARWLYWCLRAPSGQSQLWLRSTGTTAPGIKAERLRGVPIPVPAISEQDQQLEEIEDIDSRWEAQRTQLAASGARLSELKESLISAAVSGEFDLSSADGSRVPA